MECVKIHHVRRKRIDNMRLDEFIDECDEKTLYLLDIDPYMGREMNFKVYRELEGIYELWIDSAPRSSEDVMDILVSGGNMAVIMREFLMDGEMEKIVEMTENIALKSIFIEYLKEFVNMGGKKIISSEIAKFEFVDSGLKVYTIKNGEVCRWIA